MYHDKIDPKCLYQMTEEQYVAVTKLLHKVHEDHRNYTAELPAREAMDTVCGLEFVCQALGIPGYEFD